MKVSKWLDILKTVPANSDVYVVDGAANVYDLDSVDIEYPEDGPICINIRVIDPGA